MQCVLHVKNHDGNHQTFLFTNNFPKFVFIALKGEAFFTELLTQASGTEELGRKNRPDWWSALRGLKKKNQEKKCSIH